MTFVRVLLPVLLTTYFRRTGVPDKITGPVGLLASSQVVPLSGLMYSFTTIPAEGGSLNEAVESGARIGRCVSNHNSKHFDSGHKGIQLFGLEEGSCRWLANPDPGGEYRASRRQMKSERVRDR